MIEGEAAQQVLNLKVSMRQQQEEELKYGETTRDTTPRYQWNLNNKWFNWDKRVSLPALLVLLPVENKYELSPIND